MFPCSSDLNSSSFFSRSVEGKYLSRNRVLNPCHVIPVKSTVSFLSCHHWSVSLSSWWYLRANRCCYCNWTFLIWLILVLWVRVPKHVSHDVLCHVCCDNPRSTSPT